MKFLEHIKWEEKYMDDGRKEEGWMGRWEEQCAV